MYIFAQCYCINAISVCTVLFFSLLTCIRLCVWCLCVWGGWTKAMCLVRSHTNGVSLLQITWTIDNQMYKMCLVSNRPATSSSTLGIITPTSLVRALFSLGLCEINALWYNRVGTDRTACSLCLDRRKKKNQFDSSHQLTRHRLNLWHLSARTASFTTQKPSRYQKRLFAINVHCKKQQQFFTCILYFAPLSFLLLCWTSPLDSWNFLRSVICWIGPARLGFCALLSII